MPATSTSGSSGQQGDGGIINRVKDSATAQLKTQKDRGVDALGSVTQAVRSSTQRLRDEQHDTIANYVEKAADGLDRWSQQLKNKNVDEQLGDIQRLARRQPAVFIGSAFAIGLLGARFLKSSREPDLESGRYRSRGQYGGAAPLSTAHDRSFEPFDANREDDVTIASAEVVISDVTTSQPRSSSEGGTAAGRRRQAGGRSEKL